MDCFRQMFGDDSHKNWLRCVVALKLLQTPLKRFVDAELGLFHNRLLNVCGQTRCEEKCSFQSWKPNQDPGLCGWCTIWRQEILMNHTSPKGKVMWKNSKPKQWVDNKWEMAKVYMPDGHKNHESVDDFDIAALLYVMSKCKHFQRFNVGQFCEQVARVRNQIMHSPSYQLKPKEMHEYLKQIKALATQIAQYDPQFQRLSKDIDEIQNLDFQLVLPDDMEIQARDEKEHEDILFAAIQLEQSLQEREREMKRVRRSLRLRDQEIKNMKSAIRRETVQHRLTMSELMRLERENVVLQKQRMPLPQAPEERTGGDHSAPNPRVDPAMIPLFLGFVAVAFLSILAIL